MTENVNDPTVEPRTSPLHWVGACAWWVGIATLVVGAVLLVLFGGALLWDLFAGEDTLLERVLAFAFLAVLFVVFVVAVIAVVGLSFASRGLALPVAIGVAVTLPWPGAWEVPGYFLVAAGAASSLAGLGAFLTVQFPNRERERLDALADAERFGGQAEWARRHRAAAATLGGDTDFTRRVGSFEEIGIPGEGLYGAIDSAMERGPALSGVEGEIMTAEAARSLATEFPGITLFNGIKVPEEDGWDIDHALVFANLVVFMDSKNYAPGAYAWVGDSLERVPTTGDGGRPNSMKAAVDRVTPVLPPGVDVESAIVIHDSRGGHGVSITGDPTAGGRPRLLTGEQFGTWLRSRLAEHDPGERGPLKGVSARRHQNIVDDLFGLVPDYIAERHTEGDG